MRVWDIGQGLGQLSPWQPFFNLQKEVCSVEPLQPAFVRGPGLLSVRTVSAILLEHHSPLH